ncbi:MAG: acetylxylan esterase [Rikenellaceae bacterium]|jgi:cephalosporin-C deacetylase|nr:acetylxylan esterase [Rikenellaceae bacterium]
MKIKILGFVAVSAMMILVGCAPTVHPTYTVVEDAEWFALSPDVPTVKIIAQAGEQAAAGKVRLVVAPDKCLRFDSVSLSFVYEPLPAVYDLTQKVKVAATASSEVVFDVELPEAGFFRCLLIADGQDTLKSFNIGLDPEQIVSPVDAQPDFDEFWAKARAELDAVAPEWVVTPLPDSSSVARTIYLVSGRSLGGETIQGFYAKPNKPGKYPAIVHYMGYNSPAWCFDADANPDYAEFVLSVRGQGLNQPTNKYGDWIVYGLDNKDDYYYRGAFMDLVRAVDFVASRPEVDTANIFAEGGSQGGAFTMVAAAIDNRIAAAAPTIPFLSDYRDYFSIVAWPSGAVLTRAAELGIPDEELYKTLSYFDVKNFAGKITCPVIMGFGLQDGVCPPHTNFAGYNQITSPKEYRVYPQSGHWTGPDWWGVMNDFFENAKKI